MRKGCRASDETRHRMSIAKKGKKWTDWLSPEGVQNLLNARKEKRIHGEDVNRREYSKIARKYFVWTCHYCGENNNKNDLNVHHINGNNKDNNPLNLEVVCISCHLKTHALRRPNPSKNPETRKKSSDTRMGVSYRTRRLFLFLDKGVI